MGVVEFRQFIAVEPNARRKPAAVRNAFATGMPNAVEDHWARGRIDGTVLAARRLR